MIFKPVNPTCHFYNYYHMKWAGDSLNLDDISYSNGTMTEISCCNTIVEKMKYKSIYDYNKKATISEISKKHNKKKTIKSLSNIIPF